MTGYDLTPAAADDLRDIWRYTVETWGLAQAETYFDRIEACCEAVGSGRSRSLSFDALPEGVRLHRCYRHYIVWLEAERPIVIAILHDRMDIMRRLKGRL